MGLALRRGCVGMSYRVGASRGWTEEAGSAGRYHGLKIIRSCGEKDASSTTSSGRGCSRSLSCDRRMLMRAFAMSTWAARAKCPASSRSTPWAICLHRLSGSSFLCSFPTPVWTRISDHSSSPKAKWSMSASRSPWWSPRRGILPRTQRHRSTSRSSHCPPWPTAALRVPPARPSYTWLARATLLPASDSPMAISPVRSRALTNASASR